MLCLSAGTLTATLAVVQFTLAWTHSIEQTRWEEDWHIVDTTLVISEARIGGTGAGMEPPPGATLTNGVWHYRPALAPQSSLRLTHSLHTVGYELCANKLCRPLIDHLTGIDNNALIELRPCLP
jgi:hypothetical protein